jgi:hypothetical protein
MSFEINKLGGSFIPEYSPVETIIGDTTTYLVHAV